MKKIFTFLAIAISAALMVSCATANMTPSNDIYTATAEGYANDLTEAYNNAFTKARAQVMSKFSSEVTDETITTYSQRQQGIRTSDSGAVTHTIRTLSDGNMSDVVVVKAKKLPYWDCVRRRARFGYRVTVKVDPLNIKSYTSK